MTKPVIALEEAEMRSLADVCRGAPPGVVEKCGVVIRETADGLIVAATRLDVLALNRFIGLGLAGRPTREGLVNVLSAFKEIGSPRFFVQVPPVEGSTELMPWLEELGLRHYNNWIRLSRELADLPDALATSLSVHTIGPEEAGEFGRIVAGAFGYPPPVVDLITCGIGRPGWHYYLAYEGADAVAGAAMFVAGESTWFGFAGTVAEYRGRGAQTALVMRRMKDALAEGCRWVSVETAEQTPEREAPSFRNLRRLGFTVAYTRPNYLWTRAQPA